MDKVSLDEFEASVKQHPEWVNQKSRRLPDSENLSPLTSAAITARTNHVRVLINHGADVAEALKWSERNNCPSCIEVISAVRKETGKDVEVR